MLGTPLIHYFVDMAKGFHKVNILWDNKIQRNLLRFNSLSAGTDFEYLA